MDANVQAEIQKEEQKLKDLYERMKPTIWAVKISGKPKGEEDEVNCTAFAIHKDDVNQKGYLMTCAHGDWHKWGPVTVQVRRITETKIYDAVPVEVRLKADTCLLEIPIEALADTAVCVFGDGHLSVGETVMAIGNPSSCRGTCVFGSIMYPCPALLDFAYDTARTCNNYVSDALDNTPPYKILGHIFNSKVFAQDMSHDTDKSDINCARNLQANLPIVHCAGLVGGSGFSGCPLFNLTGQIVGMFVLGFDGYQVGIHVSVLKRFLNDTLTKLTQPKGEVSGTSVKRRKT